MEHPGSLPKEADADTIKLFIGQASLFLHCLSSGLVSALAVKWMNSLFADSSHLYGSGLHEVI